MAFQAPLLCLANGLLWQELEMGPFRLRGQQCEVYMAASPVQSEQVEGPPQIPGDILGPVCDLGHSHILHFYSHDAA